MFYNALLIVEKYSNNNQGATIYTEKVYTVYICIYGKGELFNFGISTRQNDTLILCYHKKLKLRLVQCHIVGP